MFAGILGDFNLGSVDLGKGNLAADAGQGSRTLILCQCRVGNPLDSTYFMHAPQVLQVQLNSSLLSSPVVYIR
jgi:hypothetical protein